MDFKKKLLLIDGHALFHRAYHALPNMTGPGGFPTGAIFGFLSMFLKALADIKPTHALVTFDVKGPTFRDKLSADYKATRKAPDEAMMVQLPKLKEILKALNMPIYEKAGFEADDLLGIICHKTPKDVLNIIVTGDLDLLQLIDNHTQVYRFKIGFSDIQIFDADKMVEIYGLHPSQWVDYKAIRGDTSDNIPGVPGIGEKGALELMKTFGSLDGVYEAADKGSKKIKDGTLKKLVAGKAKAYLSQKLATIDQKDHLDFDFKDTEIGDYEKNKVTELLHALGIRALIARLPKLSQEAEAKAEKKAEKISPVEIVDEDHLPKLIKSLSDKKALAIFTDASGVSVATSGEHSYKFTTPTRIKGVLEDEDIQKIGHDLKVNYSDLRKAGIELTPLSFDTQIAMFLADPGRRHYLLDGKDAASVFRLYHSIGSELKEKKLTQIFEDIEMPLLAVLIKMEARGIKLDKAWLKALSLKLETRITKLTKEIHKQAKSKFNIASPIQLREILFEKLKIPTDNLKKTGKTKELSTAAEQLEKLRGLHPIIDSIFEYRELTKLKSTYVDALPELVFPDDGRIHTTYNQTIAATGRLSSLNPNLQNIPIRSDLGNEVRKAFVAEQGKALLSLDYSQIELRIAASMSQDKEMMRIFKSGEDFHSATAAKIFGVKEDKITPNQRRDAKTINFSILYGVSAFGLSERSEMERGEAQEYIQKYYEAFPRLKEFIDKMKDSAHKDGFIRNPLGRIRYFPEINSSNFAVRGGAERAAVNMPLQSLAADIMKMAMIEIERKYPEANMILSVHDELVFEVDQDEAKKIAPKLRYIMESVYKLKVPIVVAAKAGLNWAEMTEI
ncbi:MAG: hypothetical protein A2660_02900 [Candidatus Doudnabacteria bacterium RIFCSPHIGHO2_01_FULL_45_18]|uniref:DNA-directed DNA polymerase n=1 Tax=Candidatus Doudnabacteria bacterium RIFCSPHIGHO2_01_FULL_45_18 TaxID=1817823 RepID=A0A1F5NQQ3_9BACT|nr:MAG: hypothetical protein A2660_02900 [Candidatus Doudnabacteria bacterium RIFCSPHIGHO2_01_FULL_45_18]